ncbi:hypothetical protein [Aureispira anguillae]|uniref:Uncharacterized protein n=1 Tax=Aureispira anguillae TaxID=2864201 RepID=A0A915YBV7_9BACT|nr:hypothetical protein [Aureispira anguillae]BDS10233.1 hypothetical protein AsAng_0009410 [Aureispira anguillae]
MNKLTPELVQKFEFYSIFLNNIFLFLGVLLLGWSLFETLFLFWLELLSALVVLIYLILIVPIKYGRPNYHQLPEYQRPALKVIGLTVYTLILHYIALVFIIHIGQVDGWDTTQGVFHTLLQMPVQLWNASLLLLTVVFLLAYLMPPLLLERQGIQPSLDVMPMQTKVMIHPSQFVAHYLWFVTLWAAHSFFSIKNPILLMAILMVLKSAFEAYLFHRTKLQL